MFQIRLKELREEKGLSQSKLAQYLHVAQSTVGMWESGKNKPEHATLIKIAEFFNVSIDYLTGTDIHSDFEIPGKGIKIPVLGKVQAGIPIEAVEDILDYEEISKEMASTGEFFALKIRGDSMEPRIKSGDVVIVRKQPTVESGDVAIVLVNGNDATCKKLVIHKDGITLVSFNATYEPRFYTNREVRELPISVLGKVVELRGKF